MASTVDTQIVQFGDADSVKAIVERNRACGWPDLEPYQKAFAYSFLVDFDHRKAAITSGRAPSSGLSILRNPLVAAFIEEQQKAQATNAFITREYITTQYVNLIPMLMGEVDVNFTNAAGDQCSGKQFRPAELKGVLQELSKTVSGFDKNKTNAGTVGGVSISIDMGSLVGGDTTGNFDFPGVTIEGEFSE